MSDEVSQFLESVERLRGQQIEEDEVRARELEEYLAAKRERQARREERARSISPQKSSPANTPSPRSSRQTSRVGEPPRVDLPAALEDSTELSFAYTEGDSENMAFSSPTKENESPADADKRSTPPARSNALSWQRRPTSRGGTRPLSMVAAQNATQRSLVGSPEPAPLSATEPSFSRDQIAQNLLAKDPSWFRQTSDRGQGSAAYRRNQVEDDERSDVSSGRAQLPGMSDTTRERSTSATSSTTTVTAREGLASPLPISESSFDRSFEPSSDELPLKSPTELPSSRPTSPTKGMGGFVQSAMMKRSDSVKRWSVQTSGLTRADTVTPSRNGTGRDRPTFPRSHSKTPSLSRPTSQHGERQASSGDTTAVSEVTSPAGTEGDSHTNDTAVPVSPSKTMDTRRWSPTKSSWLETALNRPESPKPQPKPQTPSQPAWKEQLNRKAGSTAENDTGRPASVSHRHQVSIGGLLRSSPMGTGVKSNTTDLGGIYSPPARGNRPSLGPRIPSKPSHIKTEAKQEPQAAASGDDDSAEPLAAEGSTPVAKSPAPKPKPQTPPKDFRANLRQRPTDSGRSQAAEPEFKNALGNLRRTKTQNYVAPDELKGNILRGKNALNVTDGPQKSVRKDEFKDAILKKKEDFKKAQHEGKGVTRTPVTDANKPLPEGLARRSELGKLPNARGNTTGSGNSDAPKPSPAPKPSSVSSLGASSPQAQHVTSPSPERLTRVSTEPAASPSDPTTRRVPSLPKETSAPSSLQGRVGGGKLADRFNPALAGILARGPPPASSEGSRESRNATEATPTSGPDEPSKPGPQLTHMTKGRARGPKRKAPTTAASTQPQKAPEVKSHQQDHSESGPEEARTPVRALPVPPQSHGTKSTSPKVAPKPLTKPSVSRTPEKVSPQGRPTPLSIGTRTPDAGPTRVLPIRGQPTGADKPTAAPVSPIKPHKTGGDVSQPESPRKLDMNRMSRFLDDSAVRSRADSVPQPIRMTHQRTGSRSPTKVERPLEPQPLSPTKVDREHTVPVRSAASRFGGGVKSPSSTRESPPETFDRDLLPSMSRSPGSPTRALPTPTAASVRSPISRSPVRSPTKASSELSTILTQFFGPGRPQQNCKFDAAELLASKSNGHGKVKTLDVRMVQLSGEGKTLDIQQQFERTLFEDEMYICTHDFMSESGAQTLNVYFWVGDGVPRATADDAQLFAQREAKSRGGRMVRLTQGSETSEFLQALGGAIVVLRGSSNNFEPTAKRMLCGRRHLGEVVFDEVDFLQSSLCAGFPYLITEAGKCFLWKGKGSAVDELSCARLIGMELSPSGELVECDEESEPDAFWNLFAPGTKPHSADHWRLKPKYEKYGGRLFCSDADSRQQIYEISPFSQADLLSTHIYVLDAFFEMYVIVGSRTGSNFASFRNALEFAQEYAILAASMEDRPFVPTSTVVLEGVPRDLKRVFRKWEDKRSPTVMKETGGLRRGRSLRVVPLTQALQALNE
ncbi:Villidin-like protein [Emericellopsis cladophorae]|uniref:Villidin-like protein n=1 Tax=Emericellopsis cladophorae TaxID=2686198 RepID=A0A9Q0BBU1_9HYPO|nr:Villidin-like protein [Emericellopsis cladophorae]KAI6780122.1 Villidin-like protein [Emericellopsis cladophorae]